MPASTPNEIGVLSESGRLRPQSLPSERCISPEEDVDPPVQLPPCRADMDRIDGRRAEKAVGSFATYLQRMQHKDGRINCGSPNERLIN